MKKATTIFLVFIYAFSASGVAVKADYCCDHLQSVKLVLADGAKDKEGCCKVKYQSLKVNDVHAAADILVTPTLYYAYIQNINYFFQASVLNAETSQSKYIHDPPLISQTPTYISNCVFRI